jgi:NAD(P)-dependent dehydrogenase (short-subunit alcohol dehydrogenase family)
MAKVLIIGASRGIGLETVQTALLAGHSVRALARSAGPRRQSLHRTAREAGACGLVAEERIRRNHPFLRIEV